jgi:hypothetical protein
MEQHHSDHIYDIGYYKGLKGREAMEQRLKGRLPIIDIAGHPFFVDMRLGLLRPIDNFSTMGIDVQDIPMDEDTKRLRFDYHIPSMTRIQIAPDATELPKDVVRVEVPNMYFLDPVGMAHRNGKEPRYYCADGIPLKMYRKATILPLQKTELAVKVKEHSEKLSRPVRTTAGKNPSAKTIKRRLRP